MTTTLIKETDRGASLEGLTIKQQTFVAELMANGDFNITQAARNAGYKNPSQAAYKLVKDARIQRAIGKMQKQRMDRLELTADEVLGYLASVLRYNPLKFFVPGENGFEITDPTTIPEEIGELIEGIEVSHSRDKDGEITESRFKVNLVSKAAALKLAMKHCGLEAPKEVNVNLQKQISWDQVLGSKEDGVDFIEAKIHEVENTNQS